MFQNPEIAFDDLPGLEDLEWKSMHPNYARRMQLERALIVLGPLILSIVLTLVLNVPPHKALFFIVPILLLGIPLVFWPLASVPRRGYVLRDKDIVFKYGVLWQSVTAVPFNRIQHVETDSSPLDRKFDLANLQIFTAGGSGGDLKISGLETDVAEQLRIYILEKVGATIENH